MMYYPERLFLQSQCSRLHQLQKRGHEFHELQEFLSWNSWRISPNSLSRDPSQDWRSYIIVFMDCAA